MEKHYFYPSSESFNKPLQPLQPKHMEMQNLHVNKYIDCLYPMQPMMPQPCNLPPVQPVMPTSIQPQCSIPNIQFEQEKINQFYKQQMQTMPQQAMFQPQYPVSMESMFLVDQKLPENRKGEEKKPPVQYIPQIPELPKIIDIEEKPIVPKPIIPEVKPIPVIIPEVKPQPVIPMKETKKVTVTVLQKTPAPQPQHVPCYESPCDFMPPMMGPCEPCIPCIPRPCVPCIPQPTCASCMYCPPFQPVGYMVNPMPFPPMVGFNPYEEVRRR